MYRITILVLIISNFYVKDIISVDNSCSTKNGCLENSNSKKTTRYILYDVNPGEGFNLRRDVYMRMAIFVRDLGLKSKYDWYLVLPPWSHLWHWRNNLQATHSWNSLFDVSSLKRFCPVIEFENFIADYSTVIDEAYVLQHFPDFYSWTEGKDIDWSERWNYSECRNSHRNKSEDTCFFFEGQVMAKNCRCISFHGTSIFLNSVVASTPAKAIMFDRAEIVTHPMYGDSNYWMCRRSMRFAQRLVEVANRFRSVYLNSSDETDRTERPIDFKDETSHRSAIGGPYLSVHLRRQEFTTGHPDAVPSISEAVKQIKKHLNKLSLKTVFVATDATEQEYNKIKKMLLADNLIAVRFLDSGIRFKDAELAIIDQIIASHAKFFVGTHESTFTYRIQEEREIMGFPPEMTFNRFCPTSSMENCTPPTKWLIKFPDAPQENIVSSRRNDFKYDEL